MVLVRKFGENDTSTHYIPYPLPMSLRSWFWIFNAQIMAGAWKLHFSVLWKGFAFPEEINLISWYVLYCMRALETKDTINVSFREKTFFEMWRQDSHLYIYIYIERERERERKLKGCCHLTHACLYIEECNPGVNVVHFLTIVVIVFVLNPVKTSSCVSCPSQHWTATGSAHIRSCWLPILQVARGRTVVSRESTNTTAAHARSCWLPIYK